MNGQKGFIIPEDVVNDNLLVTAAEDVVVFGTKGKAKSIWIEISMNSCWFRFALVCHGVVHLPEKQAHVKASRDKILAIVWEFQCLNTIVVGQNIKAVEGARLEACVKKQILSAVDAHQLPVQLTIHHVAGFLLFLYWKQLMLISLY